MSKGDRYFTEEKIMMGNKHDNVINFSDNQKMNMKTIYQIGKILNNDNNHFG